MYHYIVFECYALVFNRNNLFDIYKKLFKRMKKAVIEKFFNIINLLIKYLVLNTYLLPY